ncbi:MAG: hypothetical protein IKB38_07080 [Clostridia bacterium]|nr:hypothetical protein [Clostridia bacterium]
MKKRIISLLLAVVMLFSCLSLNVFATEETASDETPSVGTTVADTLKAHTDAEIKAYIDALTDSAFMFHDGTTRSLNGTNLNDSGTRFTVTEDGRLVVGPAVTAGYEAHFNLTGHSVLDGRTNILKNYKANDALHGQSFVVQADIELTDYFIGLNTSQRLLQITSYAGYGTYNNTTSRPKALQLQLLQIAGNKLQANIRGSGYQSVAELKPNTVYSIAVHVNPQDIDLATKSYGSYDVYVNGSLVAERLGFLSEGANKGITMPENQPFFPDGVFSDNANSILKAGQTAYFFTDTMPDVTTDTDADGIPDIYEGVCGITAETVPTKVELIGTAKGVQDFALGGLRFLQMGTNIVHTENAFYLDNALVYRADEYVNVLEHALVKGEHTHDFTKATTDVTYTCAVCDGYKVVTEALDANGDRVCDVCVGELDEGGILSTDELANYADSVPFSSNTGRGNGITDYRGAISQVTDDNDNTYTKVGAPTKEPTTIDTAYMNLVQSGFGYPYQGPTLNNFEALKGKSYVVSADMKLYDTIDESIGHLNVLGTMSYLQGSDGCTALNALNVVFFLRINVKTGVVEYLDAAKGANSYVSTGISIKDGKFHTLAVHHTPAEVGAENTYDAYIDGRLVASNVQALTNDQNKQMTFTSGELNYANSTVKQITVNGAVDFFPALARTHQLSDSIVAKLTADQYAWDNLKFYYADTFFEHIHDYELTHQHDLENGTNHVTYTCSVCGLTKEATVVMSDRAQSGVLTPDEVAALAGAENMLAYGECTDDNPFAGLKESDSWEAISVVTDEATGNKYIKYGASTATGNGGCYIQKTTSLSGRGTVPKYMDQAGRAYVISVDVMHYGAASLSLFEIISYTAGTDGISDGSKMDTVKIHPAKIFADGTLQYDTDGTQSYTPAKHADGTDVVLDAGKFYTVTLHHTPATNTFDLFVDGECVANDIKALGDAGHAASSWTSSALIEGKTITMEGAKHFTPGIMRFTQLGNTTAGPDKDYIAFDAPKLYYSDVNYECAHSFVNDTCEWCGKYEPLTHCDICDGEVISENAAVVGKSVSLGELIDMNVYVKYLGDTEGVYANLVAGAKEEAIALDELTADKDGTYKLTLPLNSVMMAEDVTLYLDGGEYTTSVKEYAEELISITTDEVEKKLAKALLNFGAAAQEYFAVKNDDAALDDVLANAGLAEADKTVTDVTASDAFAAIEFAPVDSDANDNVAFTAATLTFSSKTHVKIYFTASENVKVTLNGRNLTPVEENGEYYIAYTVTSPADLMKVSTIVITDGDASYQADVSAALLVKLGVENAADADLVPLLKAFAYYATCAAEYVA